MSIEILEYIHSQLLLLLFLFLRNFMNDSFRTNVFVRYPPETIGCACIFLSARQLGVCTVNDICIKFH